MEEGNFAVIVDAKSEYTKQLINTLKGGIYQGIKKIFVECREKCQEKGELGKVLTDFQAKLEEVPKWNQEVILGECETLLTESKCDWIEDLITAVFVSHTRVLTSINFSKNKRQINLKIPKTDHFIHQCYIDIARIFYKAPYLMDDTGGRYEYQRNRNEAEILIEKSIENTIRKQLPVKHILQEYLGNDYVARENEKTETTETNEVSEAVDTNVEEDTPKLSDLSMDIKELVKTEIENSVKAQEKSLEPEIFEVIGKPELEEVSSVSLEKVDEPEPEKVDEPEPEPEKVVEPVSLETQEEPIAPPEYSVVEELETLTDNENEEDFGGLDLDLDLDVSTEVDLSNNSVQEPFVESLDDDSIKSLNLSDTHNLIQNSDNSVELDNQEVKTILLDTKNSLSDEDIEKKKSLKNKKAFNFFNDSVEDESE